MNRPTCKLITLLGSDCSNGNNTTRYGTACTCGSIVGSNCISRCKDRFQLNGTGNHFKGCGYRFFIGKGDCYLIENAPLIEALTCLGFICHYSDSFALCGSFNDIIPNLCNTTRNGNGEFVAVGRAGIVIRKRTDHITAHFGIKLDLRFSGKLGIGPVQSHLANSAKNGSLGKEHVFTNIVAFLTANSNIHIARGVDNDHARKGINASCQVGVIVSCFNIQACISQHHDSAVCANAVNGSVRKFFCRGNRYSGFAHNCNTITRFFGIRISTVKIVFDAYTVVRLIRKVSCGNALNIQCCCRIGSNG